MTLSERNIGDLQELYAKVHRKIVDGRAAEAVEVCETIVKTAAELGDALTLTHYPTCEACDGTAEIANPAESDRRVRCQDMAYRTGKPGECRGNRYGRMSPAQLQEYVVALATPKAVPIHDSEGPASEPEKTDEMQPTRAPVNVYDRDAVIRFNDLREATEQPPLPVPEADEEVLAHDDGTYTVRKRD